jgi:hypothetical protein
MRSIELCEKRAELFAFEFVRHGSRYESREAPGSDAPTHGRRKVGGNADGQLGCGLCHGEFLPR